MPNSGPQPSQDVFRDVGSDVSDLFAGFAAADKIKGNEIEAQAYGDREPERPKCRAPELSMSLECPPADRKGRMPQLFVFGGLVLAAVALALLLFSLAVVRDYEHDEEQYVAVGVLTMGGRVYRDFFYNQTPSYPELLAGVFRLFTDGSGYFLIARLFSWACAIATCALLWGIGWRITGRHAVGFGTSLLFAGSPLFIPNLTARNDIAPCAVALTAVALVLRAIQHGRRTRGIMVLAGFCLALAVGLKLIYAFVPLGVMAYVLIADLGRPLRRRLAEIALPLAIGGIGGGLILLSYGIGVWDTFLYENYTFHREVAFIWYQSIGSSYFSEAKQLVNFLIEQEDEDRLLLKDTTQTILILMAVTVVVAMRADRVSLQVRRRLRHTHAPLVLSLAGLALIFGFLPHPPHSQYFMPLGLFLALSVPFLFKALAPLGQVRSALFGGAIIIGCLPGSLLLLKYGFRALDPTGWTVTRVQGASQDIRQQIEAKGVSGPVLTLSPIFALEAGLPIYRELSAGPFFFRTADRLMPAATVESLNGVSPATLDALLQRQPPAAVLVGNESLWIEQPLIDYAQTHGFEESTVTGFAHLRLFIRSRRVSSDTN